MNNNKFEKIFNKIKNTNYDNTKLSEDETSLSRYIDKGLKDFSGNVSAEGFEKSCVFIGDKKQYAMLKYKNDYYSKCATQCKTNSDVIKFNNWLVAHGVRTPKLYTIFYADSRYHEIFQRVRGPQVYDRNIGKYLEDTSFGKPTDYKIKGKSNYLVPDEKKYSIYQDSLFKYITNHQKILLGYDKNKYVQLIKQYQFLSDIGFSLFDIHSGNVMLGRDGFNIIDLDIEENLKSLFNILNSYGYKEYNVDRLIKELENNNYRSPVEVYKDKEEMVCDIIDTFGILGNDRVSELTSNQTIHIWQNNAKILTKLVEAFTDLGYNFVDDLGQVVNNQIRHQLLSGVGYSQDYLKEILISQLPQKSKQ